jgi:hypothetical protein
MPRRHNFKEMAKWCNHNEGTYHNWFKKDLDLVNFNRELIDTHGSGNHFIIFDPSFLSKSGKKTPSRGDFWPGCAGRSALVFVKCLKIRVLLVAVDYLKKYGTLQTRKLYISNRTDEDNIYILRHYQCRNQIEYLFRDAKQYTGLMQCQSTNAAKLINHLNISLTAVSVAKATHWVEEEPFSMNEINQYYHNLKLVELFSQALDLDPIVIKNNPKTKTLLFSMNYDAMAA